MKAVKPITQVLRVTIDHMKALVLCSVTLLAIDAPLVRSFLFQQCAERMIRTTNNKHVLHAGFGKRLSKPTGKNKVKSSDAKKAQEKLVEKYGGDIALGTEERINKAMRELPPHLQMAAQLYKQTEQWNAHFSKISVLDQTSIPQQDMEGARRAKDELRKIYETHGLGGNDMQKLFQKLTWDASAEAKAVRSIIGNMPKEIETRVDNACRYIADAVKVAGVNGRCLDVGCGPGILVPHLTGLGVNPSQIVGVDLSSEMIYNAQKFHKGVDFIVSDFLEEYENAGGFDGIIFCSSIHDLPDLIGALQKAATLLRPNGTIVIMHAQGASHVIAQNKANPVMVKRSLPDTIELTALAFGLRVVCLPADAGSSKEAQEGYLAVLCRT